MRNLALAGSLFALAIGNVACASHTATAPTAVGQRYAELSPVVADAPPMIRRAGPIPALSELRSSNPDKLKALLGEPSLRRKDHASEMWQYTAPECVLLLFLYPTGNSVQVTHLEAQPGGASDSALDKCIHAAARRPMPAKS